MIWRVVLLLTLTACVLTDEHARSEQRVVRHFGPEHQGHHGELAHIGENGPEHHDKYASSFPSYEFAYKVNDPHTKDYKGHIEKRHGDEVVGEYWLRQPDGLKRIVKYRVDKKNGFQAHVRYEPYHDGHHSPAPKPVVEQVEEPKPEKSRPRHDERKKNVVEVRHHVHHPPPKHQHDEEHKPVHHKKPIHHVHVEHKIVHHKHKEHEPPQVEENKPEKSEPEEHKPEESRPRHDEHKSVIENRQRTYRLPLKSQREKPIPRIPMQHKPVHHDRVHEPDHVKEREPEEENDEEREDVHHDDQYTNRHHNDDNLPLFKLDPARHYLENYHAKPHHHAHQDNRPHHRVHQDDRPRHRVHHHDRPHHRVHQHDRPDHLEQWQQYVVHKAGRITDLWKNEARRREDEHHKLPHVPLYRHYEPYYGHHQRYYRSNGKSKKNE
ncbi:histidine-rich glycoprotein-like [Hyposmocoma kahamanoa]|uniref:histidine-rich glycoprotein-like n=1 Tax=Hyposmocoma kahamanoa TaxID=1477025 RepID=UPI000E6D80FE|nr:histidine-rich glycoprotein-like [Hyposmocoma kahamanoa]